MSYQVPAARNLYHDPRPTTLSYFNSGTLGATRALSWARSYSGLQSMLVTLPGVAVGEYVDWYSGTPGSSGHLSDIAGERTFIVRTRVARGSLAVCPAIDAYVTYTDGSSDHMGRITDIALPADGTFTPVTIGPYTTNAAKTASYLRVRVVQYNAAALVAGSVHWGGTDGRESTRIDQFIVGGATANHTWEGTANASPSNRAAFISDTVRGKGGQLQYAATYYLVERNNQVIDDITEWVNTCSLTQDLLVDGTKGQMSVELDSRGIISPWSDQWIRPHLTITHPDGSVEGGEGLDGALGLYSVEPGIERYGSTGNSFSYQGYDLLWLLQQETLVFPGQTRESGAVLLKDQLYWDKLIDLFADVGFTHANGLLYLPKPVGAEAKADRNYGAELGRPYLEFITLVLDGQGWRRPWPTLQGQVTSEPRRQLSQVEPAYTFRTGRNSEVRWDLEVDPELGNVANRVTVFAKRSGKKDAIKVVEEIEDPAHPFYPGPGGLERYIDAPRIDVSALANEAAGRRIALDELEKRAMLPYTVRMRTRAMIRPLNEVYLLDLNDFEGEPIDHGQGKYWCTGWQMDLGMPWEMTHNLRRVIPATFDRGPGTGTGSGNEGDGKGKKDRRDRENRNRRNRRGKGRKGKGRGR